jgi:hypothetical protein
MTGVDLRSKDVVPNFALKSLIAARNLNPPETG